ncbi:MAG: Rrf2 family transcriptional regulator [Bryobacterales bacterium]
MMSTTSQYALRALARLSSQPEGTPLLGRDLARESNIPANYLSKLLWQLGNAGLVYRRAGRAATWLNSSRSCIRLIDVVEVDPVRVRPACLMGQGECNRRESLLGALRIEQVRDVYLDFLQTLRWRRLPERADRRPLRPLALQEVRE